MPAHQCRAVLRPLSSSNHKRQKVCANLTPKSVCHPNSYSLSSTRRAVIRPLSISNYHCLPSQLLSATPISNCSISIQSAKFNQHPISNSYQQLQSATVSVCHPNSYSLSSTRSLSLNHRSLIDLTPLPTQLSLRLGQCPVCRGLIEA